MHKEIGLLKNIPLFSGLEDDELIKIYSILNTYDAPAGKVIFREGESGEEMFILTKGKVGINVRTNSGDEIEIAECLPGNFFGEMSIFDNAPRSATCTAKEGSTILALSGKAFYDSIEKEPQTAIKIMHKMVSIIAGRLEKTGAFLSDIVLWGEKARKRAITDEVTGLYNRRFFDDSLKEQFAKAKLFGNNLSLIMLDLDHFGTLNNEYGQKVGDEIILSATNVFKKTFRDDDILVRYGGDEFVFILKDMESEKALEICNAVVEKLQGIGLSGTEGKSVKKITGSIGIASYPTHAKELDVLKEAADKAVYQAKEKGRNCAVIYEG